ncbi:MAG: hypothetical protein ACYC26_05650 [Phycisphaerales bacterium]
MGERDRKPPMSIAHPSKCLLWVSAGCDVPLELLDGLRRRDVAVRQVHDAPSVMAALATEGAKVLVLVEPAMLRDVERLVKAVRGYHDASIWRYERGAMPALTPWMPVKSEGENDKSEVESGKSEVRNDTSDFPLPTSDLPDAPNPETEPDDGSLLTQAELTMLLNDDDDLKEANGL